MQSHAISCLIFFFFHDTATTEIYTLSLHDALPISIQLVGRPPAAADLAVFTLEEVAHRPHARVRVVSAWLLIPVARRGKMNSNGLPCRGTVNAFTKPRSFVSGTIGCR